MISLKTKTEPYEIELSYGITVTVRPLNTSAMAAAEAAARRRLEAIEAQHRERKEAGLPAGDLPDLDDESERDGLLYGLLVKELAARHVVAWSGVAADDGEAQAPLTPENAAALMELYPVGERFFAELTLRQVLLNAAKNASGPSAAGTSGRAEGPATAEAAPNKGSPAPAAA